MILMLNLTNGNRRIKERNSINVEKMKKREYRDLLDGEIFNLKYYDKIVDSYLNQEEVTSRLDWGSNLANLIFLTAMGWYK